MTSPALQQSLPKDFDFNLLGSNEETLMNELGLFTFQSSFLNLLKKDYGNTNLK